ncbi:MAG: hypothetical protein WC391_01865 [Methanoregula sp.]
MPLRIPETFIKKCAILAGIICLLLFVVTLLALNITPDYVDILTKNEQMKYNLVFLAVLAPGITLVSLLLLMEIGKK